MVSSPFLHLGMVRSVGAPRSVDGKHCGRLHLPREAVVGTVPLRCRSDRRVHLSAEALLRPSGSVVHITAGRPADDEHIHIARSGPWLAGGTRRPRAVDVEVSDLGDVLKLLGQDLGRAEGGRHEL